MWTAEKRRKAVETRKKNGGYKNSHKFTKKDLEKGVETRRKNGSYNKNLHGEWTDEMRKNMSVAQLNRPPCKDTTRKKLSESNKGKVRTEEMKKRYSISRIEGLANGALKLSGRGKDKEYKNMNDGGMITIKCYVNDDYHLTDKTFLDVITKNGLLTYTHTNSKGWKLSYDGGN